MHELSWQNLKAWQQLTGTPVNSWEAQAMIALSRTYTAAVQQYSGTIEPAPYQPLDFDRSEVADKVRNALRNKRR